MTPGSSPTIDAAWHRAKAAMPTKGKPVLVLAQLPDKPVGGFMAQARGIGVNYGPTEVAALDALAERLEALR